MTGSFRKVKNVVGKYKNKKVAILMSGFSHDGVKRFEIGLKTLGYNIIGDVSDCYKGRMESLKSFNHDDWFYIQKECGQAIDADLVVYASLGFVTKQFYSHTNGTYTYYKNENVKQYGISLIDTSKNTWLVFDDSSWGGIDTLEKDVIDRLLVKFDSSQN
jgi:hypothetical protein